MPRRHRRPHHRARARRLLAVLVGGSLLLAGCATGASTDAGQDAADRLDAVTVSGELDAAPVVAWSAPMRAAGIEVETLVDGTGPEVAEGGSVLAQVWIGDGTSRVQAYSSWEGGDARLLTADRSSAPAIARALTGARIGSRLAVTADAQAAFGDEAGNPALGLGARDSVLMVLDLVSAVATAPSGAVTPAPAGSPVVVETAGRPTSLDLGAVAAPVGRFQKVVLSAGAGEPVRQDMTVVVRHLAQTYVGDRPFEESYSGPPLVFRVGSGAVVEGLDTMVAGSTVGSRILIEVPPMLGYGAAGDLELGITGTDTLFYVVDVLAAA